LDFESKILVKEGVAELLRAELSRPSWRGETITLSGVTDCYQPA
jgi:DNA repair photolyase